jgi:RNA polymerase sigma-70 factor (ECF subfamily)
VSEEFSQMYRQHYGPVLRYALRRTDPETARDIAAETFLVAWRRRHQVPDPTLPWLYGVSRRVLANERRSGYRRVSLQQMLDQAGAVAPASVDDPAELVSEVDRFRRLLFELTPGDREVLRLVAWEQLSLSEAAQVLGCTTNGAAVRLHRARRRLAALLDPTPPSPAPALEPVHREVLS